MNEADALDILHQAIWTSLLVAGPAVAAAMLIGIAIGLFQALTQVQEATLTFVPKIIGVTLVLVVSAPLTSNALVTFSQGLYAHIETGFGDNP